MFKLTTYCSLPVALKKNLRKIYKQQRDFTISFHMNILQNEIWKIYTLLTLSSIVRNETTDIFFGHKI